MKPQFRPDRQDSPQYRRNAALTGKAYLEEAAKLTPDDLENLDYYTTNFLTACHFRLDFNDVYPQRDYLRTQLIYHPNPELEPRISESMLRVLKNNIPPTDYPWNGESYAAALEWLSNRPCDHAAAVISEYFEPLRKSGGMKIEFENRTRPNEPYNVHQYLLWAEIRHALKAGIHLPKDFEEELKDPRFRATALLGLVETNPAFTESRVQKLVALWPDKEQSDVLRAISEIQQEKVRSATPAAVH